MIYAISDIHGCYEKYIDMLKKFGFNYNDKLYVLGDVLDRGNGGIDVLLDMINRKNVIPLFGNHDYTAYIILDAICTNKELVHTKQFDSVLKQWLSDGGEPTYNAFMALNNEDKNRILLYMSTFSYYYEVTIGEKRFLLSHTLPEKEILFAPGRMKSKYFLIGEPDYDETYFSDKYTVSGHTPTSLIKFGANGILKQNNHIAIDCGAVFGGKLGCICLNDLTEFYV